MSLNPTLSQMNPFQSTPYFLNIHINTLVTEVPPSWSSSNSVCTSHLPIKENFPCPRHDGVCGSRGTALLIFNIGARWRWAVTFTSLVSQSFSVMEAWAAKSFDRARSSYQPYALEWSPSTAILDQTCTCISCFPQVYPVHLDQSYYDSRWTIYTTVLSACNFRTIVQYGYRQGWLL